MAVAVPGSAVLPSTPASGPRSPAATHAGYRASPGRTAQEDLEMSSRRLRLGALLGATAVVLGSVRPAPASAATGQRLDLEVLVIGGAKGDPTTDAWTSELDREGVPFTVVRPQQGDALPTL